MDFDTKTFTKAITRQRYVIAGTVLISIIISQVAFRLVARNYKVNAVISIQTQYFQIPLVRDFIPETYDSQELRAQRSGIIRRALNHEYLKALAQRFELFPNKKAEDINTFDLDDLSKKFEVIPTGTTSFLIGFGSKDPNIGYKIIQDVLSHFRDMLSQERRANLLRVHAAIQDRLDALSFGGGNNQTADASMLASRPDLVQLEVERVQEEIRALKTNFSDKHPKISELTHRLTQLSKWLKPGSDTIPNLPKTRTFSGAKVDPASKDLFQDLLKKYHYLEVVIFLDQQSQDSYLTVLQEPFIPRQPIWPKRPIFLIWGVATGFLVGAMLALAAEILRQRGTSLLKVSGLNRFIKTKKIPLGQSIA